MARESKEQIQESLNAYAEQDKRNRDAMDAEQRALDKLNARSGRNATLRTGVTVAGKPRPGANKSITPAGENKDADTDNDALADVPLTGAARARAQELGLDAADFKRRKKTGSGGNFTVEDVERIAGGE